MEALKETKEEKVVLGKGAFSIVYKDTFNDEPCAIKYADKNENSRRYLRHEVQILEALQDCKHVVKMMDYNISRNGYIKYEILHMNLHSSWKVINMKNIKLIADQLLEALREIHSRGVIHCDLKPENIMFTSDGVLRIIDFGNALFADELLTVDQSINTLYYRPPEYIIGAPLDYRVDYWAFGCIIMELLIETELFTPVRENNLYLHGNMLGQMIMIFGNFSDQFIDSGNHSHKYFDTKNNNVYRYKYLLGAPTSLYKILRNYGYDKEVAKEWADFLFPFFIRP